jgi:AraC-like DNA-binding protein
MISSHIIFIVIIVILVTIIIYQKLHQPSHNQHFPLPEHIGLRVSNNDIMHFLKGSSESVKMLFEHRGIDFKMKVDPESMMGWIDTELLDRILILLLSDTAKRLDNNGKVNIHAYTNKEYDSITIRISDNGPKMAQTGQLIIHYMVAYHRGTIRNEYFERQGNTTVIELPIKKDAYETEQLESETSSAFHIPNNIELHVPTIELPTGYEEGNSSLREIMQAPHSVDQEFLRRAVKCINDHISETDYDRQTFASDMGCSVSTLYNKIRELTGKNISNFARDIRIKTACKLAKDNPDLRVSDIAYQVGFKDPKYFATSFKRVTGMQPKEYILQIRDEANA